MATALITGASAGLGTEYAKLFAADKHDVVLVARRRDRLEVLGNELAATGVRAQVIDADLGAPAGVERVVSEVRRLGVEVEFLVNNAGFGSLGPFAEADAARQLEMIQLNVTSLVVLTHAFLPPMIARGHGRVLNIGSTAGFVPGPFMATYYASKAFVNSFTEALSHELRGTGVTATVSCPGATATEFATVSGSASSRLFRMGAMTAEEVARGGYQAMLDGKALAVHGLKNKFSMAMLRLSPRSTARAVAAALNGLPSGERKSLPKKS